MLFSLPDAQGQEFNATDHLPLVLYFYPKDSTPGCTTEAEEFNALLPQLLQLGYTVVGISRDSAKSHQKFINKLNLQFNLLCDINISLMWIDRLDYVNENVCHQFDVIKEKNMYGKKILGIERSTFILNHNGHIIHEWRKVRAAGHAQQVLNTLVQANA